jgi:LmbE family N-acetylglucosaminyl deacetylase
MFQRRLRNKGIGRESASRARGARCSRARRNQAARSGLKVLLVVAHPDDESVFAATLYRLSRELGAIVDHVVITNGEGGFRYSAIAEAIYGHALSDESVARRELPEIRKRETVEAGRILGVRRHYFLGEKDDGYTQDLGEGERLWDVERVEWKLSSILEAGQYQFVITLLPDRESHGHHQTTALILDRVIGRLPEGRRPVVLGAEAGCAGSPSAGAARVDGCFAHHSMETFEFDRGQRHAAQPELPYSIIVNWVIAAHKSQGLLQLDNSRHDVERFWLLCDPESGALEKSRELFARLRAVEGAEYAA